MIKLKKTKISSEHEFFTQNKNIFLRYIPEWGQFSASEVYDNLVRCRQFDTIRRMFKEQNNFNLEEKISQIMADLSINSIRMGK